MAYDDYFVVMAQILSYLYSKMKKGEKVDAEMISFMKLSINREYHRCIIGDLFSSGYIRPTNGHLTGDELDFNQGHVVITAKGIEYLHEANVMHRALAELKRQGGDPAKVVEFLGL